MSLATIARDVKNCKKCRLYKTAHCGVPGEGPANAKIMLVGQAPGREEDRTGRPFVGRAGRYLDAQLERIGLKRSRVFITSVVKHYPPKNRTPRKDEIAACKDYLFSQIAAIKPSIIVLMGNVAHTVHDEISARSNTAVLETCHPAAAMRFPQHDKAFTRDFNTLKRLAR